MSCLKSFPRVIWHQNQSKWLEKKETQTVGFCVSCIMYDLTQYVGIDETLSVKHVKKCMSCENLIRDKESLFG